MVKIIGDYGRHVGSPRPRTFHASIFIYFFQKILLFMKLVHFPFTFNSYLCNIFTITFRNKLRTHPLSHVLITSWLNSVMNRLYKQDGVLSVLYHQIHFSIQKIHHLFRVSKGLEEQNCLQFRVCAASHSICNGWRYAHNIQFPPFDLNMPFKLICMFRSVPV